MYLPTANFTFLFLCSELFVSCCMLWLVDVYSQLWQSEAGTQTKQVLRGEPISGEFINSCRHTHFLCVSYRMAACLEKLEKCRMWNLADAKEASRNLLVVGNCSGNSSSDITEHCRYRATSMPPCSTS